MYNPQEQDTYLRTHYIELNGTRLKRNLSTVVREHIVAFFNHIFPAFQAYYRSNLHENVTIIVAYKEAVSTDLFRPLALNQINLLMLAYSDTPGSRPSST